jgi:hypothetical protein
VFTNHRNLTGTDQRLAQYGSVPHTRGHRVRGRNVAVLVNKTMRQV